MPINTGETIEERYRVVKLLGQGGMGAVYQAWDTRLNRPVALKEMSPQPGLDAQMLADLRRQFKQEAQILATLVHPNLVRVTDYFSWRGSEYLVMDFVEGESLAQRIRREGPQPEAQVLAWAGQLLDALAYCHSKGVIHRDIKPANIIIAPDERAVLVDFGLVKLWDPRDPRTRTVMRGMGTPEYAPPEQYDTHTGHTDPRSDIYSLGATLYHVLTGRLPPTATQRMANPSSFIPPRRINSTVTAATEAVVLKALAIAMDQRFQSTAEMAQALGFAPRAATTAPRRAPAKRKQPPSTAEMKPPRKRGGMLLGLGGAGLAAVGVGCLLLTVVAVVLGLTLGGGEGGATPPTVTHGPTATVRLPTVTPRPTSTGGGAIGNTLLRDDFSNSASGWEIGDYDAGSVGYKDGAYFVSSLGGGNMMWGVANSFFDDVVIDVDTTQVRAPANDNNGYGVVCREQGDINATGYFLLISGDGAYGIVKAVDGDFEWLVEWTSSDVIHQGDATNHLRVICEGTTLALFVNGKRLATAEDSTYAAGDIALAAVSLEENEPTEIAYQPF